MAGINTPTAVEAAAWLEANPEARWHEFSEEFGLECAIECSMEWAEAICIVWDAFSADRAAKAKAKASAEAARPEVQAFEAANLARGEAYVAYLEASRYAGQGFRRWSRMPWEAAERRASKLEPYVESRFAAAKATYEALRIAAKAAGRSFSERGKELSAVEVEQIRSDVRAEMDKILRSEKCS